MSKESDKKSKTQKPLRSVTILTALAKLAQEGPQTRKSLGLSHYFYRKLIDTEDAVLDGTQKVTDAEGNVLRGHPANVIKATSKGRKAGQAWAKKQVASEPEDAVIETVSDPETAPESIPEVA